MKRHVLRLLWHVHPHLPKERVEAILELVSSEMAVPSKKEKPKHSKDVSIGKQVFVGTVKPVK
jgi:hypothetical protein